MKNCLMCSEPFSGKRSDSLYCSNSCKAKYFEQKKKGELPKNGLNGLTINPLNHQNKSDSSFDSFQFDGSIEKKKVKSVDAEDLTPFDNLVDDWNELDRIYLPENNLNNGKENKLIKILGLKTNNTKSELPAKFIIKEIAKDNPLYLINKNKISQAETYIEKCNTEIERLNSLLKKVENDTGNIFVYGGVAGGIALAGFFYTPPPNDIKALETSKNPYAKRNHNKFKKENSNTNTQNIFTTVISLIIGGTVGAILKSEYKENNNVSKTQALIFYNSKLKEITAIKKDLIEQKEQLIKANYFVKNKIIETIEVQNPEYEKALLQLNKDKANLGAIDLNKPFDKQNSLMDFETLKNKPFEGLNIQPLNKISDNEKRNPLETDKVSSMKKISNMKFELLNFKGKWNEFFGLPQTNFFCVIHGMSGEGKTNFSIQFAKYLAENFGNVLYVSGEEGFAPTFQQKIKALGADNIPRLYAADIRTGQEILTEIDNKYHFIVIDSVNNMDIDPDMMKAIRNKFRKSGIIAICQSTKDGKIRGSYQIVHDSDIAVRVTNGIAITTKNRFKEKHQEFNVFEAYRKPKLCIVKKLGNTDNGDDLIFKNTI